MISNAIMSRSFCPVAWNHISVKNNGFVRLCSHSNASKSRGMFYNNNKLQTANDDFYNCDTIKDIRKKMIQDVEPEQCIRCHKENRAGHTSRQKLELEHTSFDINQAKKVTNKDGSVDNNQIQSLDIRLGNQCNAKCIMCWPAESSAWYKDYKLFTGKSKFIDDGVEVNVDTSNTLYNWVDLENIEHLINKNIKSIFFAGGEPLITKKNKKILQLLLDNNNTDVYIEYNTNCSMLPEPVLEMLTKFKTVKFHVSIDGPKEINEYIRYPLSHNNIIENIKKLDQYDNFTLQMNPTINILNLEYLSEFIQMVQDLDLKNIDNLRPIKHHPVHNPQYLNITSFPKDLLDKIFEKTTNQINNLNHRYQMIFNNLLNDYKNFYSLEKNNLDQSPILSVQQESFVDLLDKVKKHRSIELPKDSIIRSYYK